MIWGVFLPLIGLPYSLTGLYPALYPALPVLNVALSIDGLALGTLVMSHHDMIAGSLALTGLGISFLILPPPLEWDIFPLSVLFPGRHPP
ncbi:hypothetical protein N825_23800 [Skermanella stibiiresistens SB22]|uniref:Uncharacterized protein n=1 Tax=Skermanella stibiiresistens SB22 TaxID=1385369 RepID=W9H717_9PROT|nr:hypothetical protein N825_23800 [Skermanella stibiiresistens SB22]